MRFVESIHIIGCGGIGSWLLPPLLRFLNTESFRGQFTLWDGDVYTPANAVRQEFMSRSVGWGKAEAQAESFRTQYSGLRIQHRNEFVMAENVHEAVPERSLVFVCVDNHPARALVARHAEKLRDVCVLSIGNEKWDGNCCVMLRRAGKPLTTGLLERHPEIAAAKRGDRTQMGCEDLVAAGDTQLLVTNFMAATAAFVAFHALWTQGDGGRRRKMALSQEVYFDVGACAMSAAN